MEARGWHLVLSLSLKMGAVDSARLGSQLLGILLSLHPRADTTGAPSFLCVGVLRIKTEAFMVV